MNNAGCEIFRARLRNTHADEAIETSAETAKRRSVVSFDQDARGAAFDAKLDAAVEIGK